MPFGQPFAADRHELDVGRRSTTSSLPVASEGVIATASLSRCGLAIATIMVSTPHILQMSRRPNSTFVELRIVLRRVCVLPVLALASMCPVACQGSSGSPGPDRHVEAQVLRGRSVGELCLRARITASAIDGQLALRKCFRKSELPTAIAAVRCSHDRPSLAAGAFAGPIESVEMRDRRGKLLTDAGTIGYSEHVGVAWFASVMDWRARPWSLVVTRAGGRTTTHRLPQQPDPCRDGFTGGLVLWLT